MNLKEEINQFVNQAFTDDSFFLVDISIAGSAEGTKKIEIIIDKDDSITIDQCAEISRKVARELEEKDLVSTAFILEVSSPGLDRPFQLLRQYKKNIGKRVDVMLLDGKIKRGKIQTVDEQTLNLMEELPNKQNKKKTGEVLCTIPMAEIKKTVKVVLFK
jgi:ribosome maturation factor RimP